MLLADLHPPWVRDLPVCFPARPCAQFPPLVADVVNVTSALTPVSAQIGVGCFVLTGATLLVVAARLRPHADPGLRVVALAAALGLLGMLVSVVTDARSGAISAIYGLDGPGGPELYGSWWLVSEAARVMTVAGLAACAATAAVAVVRSRAAASRY